MKVLNYEFEGPYLLNTTKFNSVGAVYVISNTQNSPIDVGQTDDLKERMTNHERENCWLRNSQNAIMVYVLVNNSERERLTIESRIRSSYGFKCGDY